MKTEIINYYKKWTGDKDTNEARHQFIMMLQQKTFYAKFHKTKVRVGGKDRTGTQLDKMLIWADDNLLTIKL